VFVGYPSDYKGWKFYNPSSKKYIISERVEFDECVFPGLSKYTATSPVDLTTPDTVLLLSDTTQDPLLDLEGDGDVDDRTNATLPPVPVPVPELPPAPLVPPVDLPPPQLSILPPIPPHVPEPPRRTQRVSRPPGEWWKVKHPVEPEAEPPVIWSDDEEDAADDQHANSVSGSEPRTFKQAMHGPQSDCWRDALLEYNTLVENGTWEIVDLPHRQKAVGSGWVFKVKQNQDGSIERFKACLVAKGMKALHLHSGLLHSALSWPLLQLRTLSSVLLTSHLLLPMVT